MIGLDIDPVGWMALTSASILVNAENGGQTNGHQIGQDSRMGAGASFAVGAAKSNANHQIYYNKDSSFECKTKFRVTHLRTKSRTACGPSLWA